jgi:hypothetical protein
MGGMKRRRLLEIGVALILVVLLYLWLGRTPTDVGSAKHWHELKSQDVEAKLRGE